MSRCRIRERPGAVREPPRDAILPGVDWYVDATDAAAVRRLRDAFRDYLGRHAADAAGVEPAVLAFSELIGNVSRHAAGPAWVHVDWSEVRPRVEIHDLGPGFIPTFTMPADPFVEGGRGLAMAAELTGELQVAAKRTGGSRVIATLDVARTAQRSYMLGPPQPDSLPTPEETAEDGTIGREAFLRALIVQLAHAVETLDGPEAIESAVSMVGQDVGGRMEAEYRRARGITDSLDVNQMADLYVRLKAAIDGDFHVIEADEEKIVLGNHACPFGEVVRRAPGLCRMTSSVFGGIAARNTGGATVVLEERIAVGDPGCRVVVWLGGAKAGRWEAAHEYAPDGAAAAAVTQAPGGPPSTATDASR